MFGNIKYSLYFCIVNAIKYGRKQISNTRRRGKRGIQKDLQYSSHDAGVLVLPVTIGIMGKVFVLVDDEQVKQLLRK